MATLATMPALAPGRPSQRLGFGGGDSQIWISRIHAE